MQGGYKSRFLIKYVGVGSWRSILVGSFGMRILADNFGNIKEGFAYEL